jgi:DNA-binding SARP family transcriptional activator
MSSDPDRAMQLAELACSHPDSLGHAGALAAMAEVALSRGEVSVAADAVEQGIAVARQRRDRPGVATHLELRALLSEDPDEARQSLEEARDLWSRMNCPLEEARVVVSLALVDPASEAREAGQRAIQTLRSLGARAWADRSEGLLADLGSGSGPVIEVAVLGTPVVHVAGRPMSGRDLPGPDALELLVYAITRSASAGGRSGPVGAASLALWPSEQDRERRLEAARSELETFLAEHGADGALSPTLALDRMLLASDLEAFLTVAEEGLEAYRNGRVRQAEERLAVAESRYGGVLLDGREPDAWLAVARDDAAEVYLQVVMAMVDLAEQRNDNHGAVRLLLRVIERDAYDEGAHLRLVACLERAGRRGESRRRYRTYTARMQEIGLEPAPFPDVMPTVRAL